MQLLVSLGFFNEINGFNIAELEKQITKALLLHPQADFDPEVDFDKDRFINDVISIDKERKGKLAKIDFIRNNKPDYLDLPNALFQMMEDAGLETMMLHYHSLHISALKNLRICSFN